VKILCAWGQHNYGDPQRGESYEYVNFLPALNAFGHQVNFFETWHRSRYVDFAELNRRLLQTVEELRPDLLFVVLLGYEVWLETLDLIRGALGCPLHFDVGSSVLTLSVASAATETVFLDYRPLRARLPGLHRVAGDITRLPIRTGGMLSVSSLHVIEHIGLGRYGDPLDPLGSAKAAAELARVVAPGGRLYLSTPVGRERICFNAHRVFHPESVVGMFAPLKLGRSRWWATTELLRERAYGKGGALEYGCGMFEFAKGIDAGYRKGHAPRRQ
jgi:SAM-dependent methyltransferase